MKSKKENFYKILAAELGKEGLRKKGREDINVGAVALELRRRKNLSAVQLCARAEDLDPKTLNALEKGRIKNPSIRTLKALARGLEISVADLFKAAELKFDRNLYVGNQRGVYQVDFHKQGIRVVSFTPFVKNFFCGKVILGARRRLEGSFLQHPLPIYIAPLVGRLEIKVEETAVNLREGDNLFFNGILNHAFYNPLERETVFMMVTAPSFF